jgi:hypothetical protein
LLVRLLPGRAGLGLLVGLLPVRAGLGLLVRLRLTGSADVKAAAGYLAFGSPYKNRYDQQNHANNNQPDC